jgi:cellulose synthase/poly-beta-1,6-N-acetylglucosamine synthase-like glycosyltransferase
LSGWQPTVDVIVSTFNEQEHIDRCLDQILAQDYSADLITVVAIDGGSTDRTVEILHRRAAADPRLVVIADGVRRNLPEALRVAIDASSSELVAKVDAHGYPDRDFVRRAVEAFASTESDVACVGGRPVQTGDTPFGAAVALARTSPFGVGGSGYAGSSQREFVSTVQCGVYRRAALVAVGSFDGAMNYGEDEELNWRLVQAGHRILLDTSIRFTYITRPSWKALYRQYRNYGEARVAVLEAHPEFLRPHHLAPAVAVTGMLTLAATGVASRRARWALLGALIGYGALSVGEGARLAEPRGPAVVARVASCFSALHVGYGVGMLRALRTRAIRPAKAPLTEG